MADLKTKTARARLKANVNGYAQNLATGRALLYRKRTEGRPGKWVLRTAKESGGYSFEVLGTSDDYDDGLSYAEALEMALGRTRADPTKLTVADALDTWAKRKGRTASSDIARKNYLSAARRLQRVFPGATLRSITAKQIIAWREAKIDAATDKRARMATVNRELTNLKAALTMAAIDNGYEGDRAWTEVKKYPKADSFGKRMTILTEQEEAALIAAADPDLADMLTALQMTGARYGEMRSLRVGDLVKDRLEITRGKTGPRTITLSPRIATWFAERAGNRPASEPLLRKADLTEWEDRDQLKPTKATVAAAGLSDDVTTYVLRHGFISRALARGVPVDAVAKHCGTSVEMISESYAKYVPGQVKEWFA